MTATDFDTYYPFDTGAGSNVTEIEWSKMMRINNPSGIVSGKDNELLVYADSSGMQVMVKTGAFFIMGHYGEITTEKTLAIAAADSTNGRIDLVVVKLDWSNNKIQLNVKTGTPAVTPLEPTLTQSSTIWEVPIARITVAAGVTTIESNNVSDRRVRIGKRVYPLNIIIGSGTTVISAGTFVQVPLPANTKLDLKWWGIVSDVSGSIQIDVWADTFANFPPADADSITAGNEITITTAQKNADITLTGWTTEFDNRAGIQYLTFYVDSCTSIKRVCITLHFEEAEY